MSQLTILQTSLVIISSLIALSTLPNLEQQMQSQPKDPKGVEQLIAAEEEEEKLDEEEKGLTVPEGFPRPALIIVMGPASCGKSTVGSNLASALHLPFIDGDSLHPLSNVQKMSSGIPLTDADRLPWLALIRSTAERICREEFMKSISGGELDVASGDWRGTLGRPTVVIACSALKKWYRDILRGEVNAEPPAKDNLPPGPSEAREDNQAHKAATSKLDTYFVYCKGSKELLWERISSRKGHFMGAQMLESQLAILEDPSDEEGVAIVDIGQAPEDEARQAVEGVRALCER